MAPSRCLARLGVRNLNRKPRLFRVPPFPLWLGNPGREKRLRGSSSALTMGPVQVCVVETRRSLDPSSPGGPGRPRHPYRPRLPLTSTSSCFSCGVILAPRSPGNRPISCPWLHQYWQLTNRVHGGNGTWGGAIEHRMQASISRFVQPPPSYRSRL